MATEIRNGVRFAPSPTGRFHVGNLRTAWVSKLWASELRLPWVVRFEDIDTPRVVAGAKDQQLKDLAALGLHPDEVVIQSSRRDRHFDLLKRAIQEGVAYPCVCSRKEVQSALSTMASAPHEPAPTYSGHCRHQRFSAQTQHDISKQIAWRFKMSDSSGKDDFIIARTLTVDTSLKGFAPAYHWACAIDDADGDYNLLVRSSDLRQSLEPQRTIQRWMGLDRTIPVFHTSLVEQNSGERLEKRTKGVTLADLSISIEELLNLFEKSFDRKLLQHITSDANFGEAAKTLSLRELGL